MTEKRGIGGKEKLKKLIWNAKPEDSKTEAAPRRAYARPPVLEARGTGGCVWRVHRDRDRGQKEHKRSKKNTPPERLELSTSRFAKFITVERASQLRHGGYDAVASWLD